VERAAARRRAGDLRLYFPIARWSACNAGRTGRLLAVEKYVLAKRGLFDTDARRKPYAWELDEETRLELDRLLGQLDTALAEDGTGPG